MTTKVLTVHNELEAHEVRNSIFFILRVYHFAKRSNLDASSAQSSHRSQVIHTTFIYFPLTCSQIQLMDVQEIN